MCNLILFLLLCHITGKLSLSPGVTFTRRTILSQQYQRLNCKTNDSFFESEETLGRNKIEALTVQQLKQQLRLRGLQVSGRKEELINRLVTATSEPSGTSKTVEVPSLEAKAQESNEITSINSELEELMLEHNVVREENPVEPEVMPQNKKSKALQYVEDRGKELIDVTAYLDEDSVNKEVRSSTDLNIKEKEKDSERSKEKNPEVWGAEARIVDDYEGRSLVIDNLSRCVVEFRGSNQTMCSAFVVASRDALKNFLCTEDFNMTSSEERLREIQTKREQALKCRPKDLAQAPDEGDEDGIYKNILHRDLSDWGKYTITGAQLSAAEIQGVLLLSDVYGPFTNHTRALAEKIAFECQPVVVMVPDVFRGYPWKEVKYSGLDEKGNNYEQWRAEHDDLRVSVDIRAAAACLRESYGVNSIALWGTCYGGGRALEAASGFNPRDSIHDIDGKVGPLPVNPMACIAWYPTRYDAKKLFGVNHHKCNVTVLDETQPRGVAVMAIFAGKDNTAGANPEDAALLKKCLSQDNRVKDHMVKIFPDQQHGFAHMNLGKDPGEELSDNFEQFVDEEFGGAGKVATEQGEAEVACLLSTAWMETYSRVFLPTVGPTISKDRNEQKWQNLEMGDLSESNTRNIREEIKTALNDFKGIPDTGKKLDRFDEEYHAEIKKILMGYQEGQDAGRNTILADDPLDEAYRKIRADGYDIW